MCTIGAIEFQTDSHENTSGKTNMDRDVYETMRLTKTSGNCEVKFTT